MPLVTVLVIIKLTLRLCRGSGKLNFVIILSCFMIFKNVQNTLKRCVTVAVRCVYFFNLIKTSTVYLKQNMTMTLLVSSFKFQVYFV